VSKKILFTASTMSHIENFHTPYLEEFRRRGWDVKAIALPVSKSFFSLQNLRAINSTRKMLLAEQFDLISSHATLAGIVTRLAVMLAGKSRLSKRINNQDRQVKIFHTAHGYLFHDDKSLKKWAYLLPEMICSRVTDVLMVMNHEDLAIARKYKLCKDPGEIYYINGMGIDLSKFQNEQGAPLRCTKEKKVAFGLEEGDFVFVYAAEFSKRKNHEQLLRGFSKAVEQIKELQEKGELPAGLPSTRVKLVLAGDGVLFEDMKALAEKLKISDHVRFLGYTKNMNELYPCCDVAVTTSRIEGLPFNVMEAMACGLPVIASDIKGHRELIEHGVNGLLFENGNNDQFANQLVKIFIGPLQTEQHGQAELNKIAAYSIDHVFPGTMSIYEENII